MQSGEPHYHVWLMRRKWIFSRLSRPYRSRQAASQAAARKQPDPERRMALLCRRAECAPPPIDASDSPPDR